jgi:hypothetical protein
MALECLVYDVESCLQGYSAKNLQMKPFERIYLELMKWVKEQEPVHQHEKL